MPGRLFSIALAAAATFSVASVFAAPPPSTPAKSKQICRGGEKQLGSHIRSTRRCRTAEQWQDEEEAKGRIPASLQVTPGQNDGQEVRQPQ